MNNKEIVFLDDYEHAMTRLVSYEDVAQYVSVRVHHAPLKGAELIEAVAKASVLVLMRDRTPLTVELLDMMPRLELLVFTGTRNAAIDYAALKRRNIPVCHTQWGPSKDSTAELTWAMIMAAHKQIVGQSNLLRSGQWRNSQSLLPVLNGERLGLIGLGEIGGRVAKMGQAFGMEVITWSPNMTPERAAEKSVRSVSLEELLSSSGVVSLHLVPSASTKELINAARLKLMRSNAILVNTSRSSLINTTDLVSALYAGTPGAAALDVYDIEPLPIDDPLRKAPNILLTPHLGFVARDVFKQFAVDTHEVISAWLKQQPLPRVLSV